jgi:protease I
VSELQKKSILIILPQENFDEHEYLVSKRNFIKNSFIIFTASDADGACTGTKGLKVKADVRLTNIHPANFAAAVIIGGSGTAGYINNKILSGHLQEFRKKGKITAAICGAPAVLASAGILNGVKSTCHPNYSNEIKKYGALYCDCPVVYDQNIITARSASDAEEFSTAVINAISNF